MPDTTPLPLPECPHEDCTRTVRHYHGMIPGDRARECTARDDKTCAAIHDLQDGVTYSRCYAPRPAPQPPAVVLPTVDEVADAVVQSTRAGGWTYRTASQAVLDLIATRVPAWQPVEWEAIRPGMLIRGTRPGYRFELTVESIDRHAVRGVGGSVWMRTADGGAETAAWEVDPRTEPEDPRVAVVRRYYDDAGVGSSDDGIRDLLARLDAEAES